MLHVSCCTFVLFLFSALWTNEPADSFQLRFDIHFCRGTCKTSEGPKFPPGPTSWKFQPAPKYHTKGCSHSSADSPGARTLVFVAFEPFLGAEFPTSIARTPFCTILWRSPKIFKIALRDWNFQERLKQMTFSSEIENFKFQAKVSHQTPIFCGGILKVNIENFKRDCYVKSPPERVPGDKFLSLPWKMWWNFRKFWEWQISSHFSLGNTKENLPPKIHGVFLEIFKRSSAIDFFQDSGPLGTHLLPLRQYASRLANMPTC